MLHLLPYLIQFLWYINPIKRHMSKGKSSCAPGSATSAGKQPTSIKYNMKPASSGKSTPGSKDMGIPPFNQKAKNIEKLSSIAKDSKRTKGSDKYS